MQIDWWTLLLQAINFLILVWLLWRFLYRPVREVVEKRRQVAEEALAEADTKKEEAEAAKQRYEDDRAHLAEERRQMLKQAHADLEKEREAALQEAQKQAEAMLEEARQTIAKERGEALTEIRDQVAEMAAGLAADILRKTAGAAPGEGLLTQLEQRLEALPDNERARLANDVAADGGYLEVVTAAPLSAGNQATWAERLGTCLDAGDKVRFATDPEVLGGAALHFPHAVLSLTWAEQLQKAKDLLAEEAPTEKTAKEGTSEATRNGDEAAS